MDDGEYSNEYYDDDFENYYFERNGNRQGYGDEQRTYEPRGQYGYREQSRDSYREDGKRGFIGRGDYYRGRSGDYYNKSDSKGEINYSKPSTDLEYNSKKNFAYEDYQKRPRVENRAVDARFDPRAEGRQTDTPYSKESSYSGKPYRSRHIPAEPNCTIGVFGFNPSTTDDDLKRVLCDKLSSLSGYTSKLIMDERTNLCKGYCFINFTCLDDAITAKHLLNLENFRGQDFKCDYSYKQGILGD